MKIFNKHSGVAVLVVSLLVNFVSPSVTFAASTPSLGAAATYGILASTYTNTAAGTTVNGDVGFTTGPATPPAGVHTNYGSGAPYATAGIDQASALSALAAQPCTFTFAAGAINLSTDATHGAPGVYSPGVYCSTGAMDVGGPLTLTGSGTYIFRPDGALTSTAGSVITLADSASACDVFWTPTAATTLAATTTFVGTVINASAITVGANTTWTGRALVFNGTVTTGDTATITAPTCAAAPATLHVIKTIVNDNGGIAVASSASVHVKISGTEVTGSPQAGADAPGTSYTLAAGNYVVSEDAVVGYAAVFSGDCDASGNITLTAGDNKTCTITNNDIAPVPPASINVVKVVTNDNGRTKVIADFPLFVGGTPVVSGATNVFAAPATYAVTETADVNYSQTFSGDCDVNGNITLTPGDNMFCIVTNNDIAAPIIVPLATSGGGGSSAFVPVPPLISVVKVPSPLALPSGPGLVTYTYTLRNIGTVPITNITMVGDTCSPVVLVSGDSNANAILEVNETWVHTCSTTLSATHTNTVVASGWANGLTATDIASTAVVVGAPTVPPLIHVTKVPNPLALSAGGGMVTYTKTVTNPGIVPLSNVRITDDKCGPVDYISGDADGDALLDTTETWIYTCRTNLTSTVTNTAIAVGEANGLTARDFAIATVVVAAAVPAPVIPGLPNTGFGSSANIRGWDIMAAAMLTSLILFAFIWKKKTA